jgi:hypothetical protein
MRIIDFLITNKSKLSYDTVSNMVEFFRIGKHEFFDLILDEVYDTFPNPYHV